MDIKIIEATMKARNAAYIAKCKQEMVEIAGKIAIKVYLESTPDPWAGLFAKGSTKNNK
jgi:hypothetical protein